MDAVFHLLPDAVALNRAPDKHAALEMLADLFSRAYAMDRMAVLDALQERESLGSTGFGHAVAIPHARLDFTGPPRAALLRLKTPIEFGAADGRAVGLLFGLLSPVDGGATHLHALAAVSRLLREDRELGLLLDAPDAAALHALVMRNLEGVSRDVA